MSSNSYATETSLIWAVVRNQLNALLNRRAHPKTLCPSEVARAISIEELEAASAPSWRDLMPGLRTLCFQLRDSGEVEILQKGQVKTEGMDEVTGPIRIRKAKS
jgi:Protein of unknown function (DUF3253)